MQLILWTFFDITPLRYQSRQNWGVCLLGGMQQREGHLDLHAPS